MEVGHAVACRGTSSPYSSSLPGAPLPGHPYGFVNYSFRTEMLSYS